MYGYQLRTEFETRTGGTWPLNVGQVYTTLSRLERDGLVEPGEENGDKHVFYRCTEAGAAELREWFERPVDAEGRPRDELAIKLALALAVPGVDVARVVQAQRSATLRRLQELTRLKAGDGHDELPWSLVLESLRYAAEAELRWLDHCEASVLRAARHSTLPVRRPAAQPDRQEVPR